MLSGVKRPKSFTPAILPNATAAGTSTNGMGSFRAQQFHQLLEVRIVARGIKLQVYLLV